MTSILDPYNAMLAANVLQEFSGQYSLVVIRDYVAPLDDFTPFLTATGEIDPAFFNPTTNTYSGGWQSLALVKDGVKVTPKTTVVATKASQSPRNTSNDISEIDESAELTLIQDMPITRALQANVPLASVGPAGQAGWSLAYPRQPFPVDRQALLFAFGVTQNQPWIKCRKYSRCQANEPSPEEWSQKNKQETMVKLVPLLDTNSGADVMELQDGPGWRLQGGVPAAMAAPTGTPSGGGVVALSVVAPTNVSGPFMYNVFRAGVAVPGTDVVVSGSASTPTLTLSAQTTGAATYTVQAVGPNLIAGPQSPASASITVT